MINVSNRRRGTMHSLDAARGLMNRTFWKASWQFFPRVLKPYSCICLQVDLRKVSSEQIQDADTLHLQT